MRESLDLSDGGVLSLVGAGGKTSLMFALARELSQAGESVLTTTTTKIFKPTWSQSSQLVVCDSLEELTSKCSHLLKQTHHLTAASEVQQISGKPKLVGFTPEIVDNLWALNLFKWILVEADGAVGRPLKAPESYEPVIPVSSHKLIGVLGLDGIGRPLTDEWVFRPRRFAAITGLSLGETISQADYVNCLLDQEGIMQGAPIGVERYVFLNQADERDRLNKGIVIADLLSIIPDSGLTGVIIGQALSDPPVLDYRKLS